MIVITGLHHSLSIIELGLLNTTGENVLQVLGTASMAGQFGAAIAAAFIYKNKSNAQMPSVRRFQPYLGSLNLYYLGSTYARCGFWRRHAGRRSRWVCDVCLPISCHWDGYHFYTRTVVVYWRFRCHAEIRCRDFDCLWCRFCWCPIAAQTASQRVEPINNPLLFIGKREKSTTLLTKNTGHNLPKPKRFSRKISADTWRLNYHLMPETGWMNDPNGLCQFKAWFIFTINMYRKHPMAGTTHWGHKTSTDYVTFQEEALFLPNTTMTKTGSTRALLYREHDPFLLYWECQTSW